MLSSRNVSYLFVENTNFRVWNTGIVRAGKMDYLWNIFGTLGEVLRLHCQRNRARNSSSSCLFMLFIAFALIPLALKLIIRECLNFFFLCGVLAMRESRVIARPVPSYYSYTRWIWTDGTVVRLTDQTIPEDSPLEGRFFLPAEDLSALFYI